MRQSRIYVESSGLKKSEIYQEIQEDDLMVDPGLRGKKVLFLEVFFTSCFVFECYWNKFFELQKVFWFLDTKTKTKTI